MLTFFEEARPREVRDRRYASPRLRDPGPRHATVEALADRQRIPVTGPYNRVYFESIYFTDPDGLILEIATRGPGWTLDEAPQALGSQVKLPPRETTVNHRDEAAIAAATWPIRFQVRRGRCACVGCTISPRLALTWDRSNSSSSVSWACDW